MCPYFLKVLSVGNLYNPDVRYSFNIPIEDKPQQFFWDAYGPWQECSRLCQGEGEAYGLGTDRWWVWPIDSKGERDGRYVETSEQEEWERGDCLDKLNKVMLDI